jgi:hypothetical protein
MEFLTFLTFPTFSPHVCVGARAGVCTRRPAYARTRT